MSERHWIDDLIARSSLGTPAAKRLRNRTPAIVVRDILSRRKTADSCEEPTVEPTQKRVAERR